MSDNRVFVAMERLQKQVPAEDRQNLYNALKRAPNEHMDAIMYMPLKRKGLVLFLSIFLGGLGIDRFYLGDVGLGVTKILLSLSALIPEITIAILFLIVRAIWCFVDIFLTYSSAKKMNYERARVVLSRGVCV